MTCLSLLLQARYVKSSGRVATFMVLPRRPPVPLWLWIFNRDVLNQTCTKKSQKITGNLDMVNTTKYSTPVSFVPVTRSQQVLTTRKRRSAGRSIVAGVMQLTSDSPSSSDLPSEESELGRHQGSSLHAKSSCLFCSIRWRCSPNCQNPQARRRRWTADMHSWHGRNYTNPRPFFQN